jgi:fucose 4-O-acetylase-like acetyltransferase
MVESNTKKIIEYDMLRVVVTILVIISHCMYYRIETAYGGIDYSGLLLRKTIVFKILEQIKEMVYSFHMPLYMALSGALFKGTISKKEISFVKLIKNKATRLLIPFFIVSVFYSFPLKYISNYWSGTENVIKDFFVGQILLQGNTYLWFLPTLFILFLLFYGIIKAEILSSIVVIVGVGLNYICDNVTIVILKDICMYFIWFYVGYLFENYRNRIKNNYIVLCGSLSMICFLISFVTKKHCDVRILSYIIGFLLTIFGMFATYAISYIFVKYTCFSKSRLYSTILKNSFGLYLYSDPINYVVIFILAAIAGEVVLSTNFGVAILFASRLFISFGVALAISKVFKKYGVKYLT